MFPDCKKEVIRNHRCGTPESGLLKARISEQIRKRRKDNHCGSMVGLPRNHCFQLVSSLRMAGHRPRAQEGGFDDEKVEHGNVFHEKVEHGRVESSAVSENKRAIARWEKPRRPLLRFLKIFGF
jgi:hypothetical protein